MLFGDPQVGGVQMGVIIGNARSSLIARCQDLEFVGFNHLAQAAGTASARWGSAATDSSPASGALRQLGPAPWSDCLTEDLDLGLHLTRRGWTIRFCRTTSVTQQGVLHDPRLAPPAHAVGARPLPVLGRTSHGC